MSPPREPTSLSSRASGWTGLLVERHDVEPGAAVIQPQSTHRITLHLSAAHRLWERREGHARNSAHQRGDVVLVAAGESNHLRWDRPASFLTMTLETSFVRRIASTLNLDPDRATIVGAFSQRDPSIEHIGLTLLHELESEMPCGALFGDSLATALAAHLLTHHSHGRRPSPPPSFGLAPVIVRRVLDYIHAHLSTSISLDALARIAQLSPFHFTRQFRSTVGVPPHQYVIQARVDHARALLLAGTHNVTQAAFDAGFSHPSHLARHMRRLIGVTPGELVAPRRS